MYSSLYNLVQNNVQIVIVNEYFFIYSTHRQRISGFEGLTKATNVSVERSAAFFDESQHTYHAI